MKILRFNELIKEGYEEKPEYQIKTFFDEFTKNIKYYFKYGVFSTEDINLVDIKQINVNSLEKNLMFDFQDSKYYYQVIVIVSITDLNEEELKSCYIKVKKYNSESELIRTYGEDVDIKDLNEDKIVELFSNLDDKNNSDLETVDDTTLSDDDADLENTDKN